MTTPLRFALFAATLALVSACGNKGPLVQAEKPAAEAIETPAGEVPVELAPEATGTDPAAAAGNDTLDDTATDDSTVAPPVGTEPAVPPTPVPGGH